MRAAASPSMNKHTAPAAPAAGRGGGRASTGAPDMKDRRVVCRSEQGRRQNSSRVKSIRPRALRGVAGVASCSYIRLRSGLGTTSASTGERVADDTLMTIKNGRNVRHKFPMFPTTQNNSSRSACRARALVQFIDYSQNHDIYINEIASLAEGYAKSSYYTALGLFMLSLPGLWSLVKRSTKSKIVKKTYEIPGPAVPNAVELDDTARKIAGYFKAKNYEMQTAGQKVIFEGKYEPNFGQASYITFCSFLGLGSFALVLSIVQQDVGNYWYLMTLLSPMAGYYYWSKSGRTEKIEVKMVTSDDDEVTDIIVLGDDEEVERFRQELDLMEKGKIYVKGLLEQ